MRSEQFLLKIENQLLAGVGACVQVKSEMEESALTDGMVFGGVSHQEIILFVLPS